MHYTLKSQSEQDYVIRLKACNEGDSSEADSPLRHFYEPEMEVLVDIEGGKKAQICKVVVKNRDENFIELRYRRKAVLPQQDSKLFTNPNVYQLQCQLFAIETLMNRPLQTQHIFINLFREKQDISFEKPELPIDTIHYVLGELQDDTNANKYYREFVKKA